MMSAQQPVEKTQRKKQPRGTIHAMDCYVIGNAAQERRHIRDDETIADKDCVNLMITGLPSDVTEPELKELLQPYGEVLLAVVMLRVESESNFHSRRFGFVLMQGKANGDRASEAINGMELRGSVLKARASDQQVQPGCGVLIRNIPAGLSYSDHIALYSTFGPLKLLKLRCAKRRFSCFLFDVVVWFESPADARSAVAALHGLRQLDSPNPVSLSIPLFVKFFDPTDPVCIGPTALQPATPAPLPPTPALLPPLFFPLFSSLLKKT